MVRQEMGRIDLKYFMTDIHGDYEGMMKLLRHAGINLEVDRLVFGGDMINRGRNSAGVVQEIKALMERFPGHVQAVMGNHEEMMSDYFRYGDKLWLAYGARETLQSFRTAFPDADECEALMEWAYSLPLHVEDDEFVYTHAGLNPYEPLDEQSRDILWMSESDFYRIPKDVLLAATCNKPIVHGHTPVERIYFDGVRLNGDMGSNTYAVMEERGVGLVNLTTMEYYVYKQASGKIMLWRIGQI
jgi:serine/threonine protein phosphatase 1